MAELKAVRVRQENKKATTETALIICELQDCQRNNCDAVFMLLLSNRTIRN
jgi:hypothetical protein